MFFSFQYIILVISVFNKFFDRSYGQLLPKHFRLAYKPSDILAERSTPSGFQDTRDLIIDNGFDFEEYEVKTEDGYTLTVHRVITDRSNNGEPLLFQHGFIAASDSIIVTGRNHALVFQLADAGFDVWLNNFRGNFYSKKHSKYNVKSPKFWDFSFHESGYYDLPAVIDKIIDVTNRSKIAYVGHSMGTTTYLIMTSLRPEYNEKIKIAILMSPVATTPTLEEMTSPLLRLYFTNADLVYKILFTLRSFEFAPRTSNYVEGIRDLCNPKNAVYTYCLDILGMLFGENRNNYNKTEIGDEISYIGAGSSIKTAHHFSQVYTKGDFRQYDYGMMENLRRYKAVKPPLYPLENITSPIALFWSDNDVLLNRRSVSELANMLPNVILNYEVEDPKFTHIDFLIGNNAPEVVYPIIINVLKRAYDS